MKTSIKKEIKKDLVRIQQKIDSGESGKDLYIELVAKYTSYDSDFGKGLPCLPVETIGGTLPSYKSNLLAVHGKIKVLLLSADSTRFYKKEGFWIGVLTSVLTALITSLIIFLIKQIPSFFENM